MPFDRPLNGAKSLGPQIEFAGDSFIDVDPGSCAFLELHASCADVTPLLSLQQNENKPVAYAVLKNEALTV